MIVTEEMAVAAAMEAYGELHFVRYVGMMRRALTAAAKVSPEASAAEARLEELTRERDEAKVRLEPFRKYAETMDEIYPTPHGGELIVAGPITSPYAINTPVTITLADCRRAFLHQGGEDAR